MKKLFLPTLAISLTFSLLAAFHAPIPTWLAEIEKIYAQFQANLLPSGLSAQTWQLKELQEKGVFDFYEMRQNTLVVYYRFMNPAETKTFSLDVKTEFTGTFYAPAASAYLYYTPEHKDWVSLGSVNVK